jgi:lysophospholipase L1-like esterase
VVICFVSWLHAHAQESDGFPAVADKNLFLNTQNDSLWKRFAMCIWQLKNGEKRQVTIVHLGDSHIQGGYFTNRFRELITMKYGEAGRGFIFPYSFLKTNGPEDVRFSSSSEWTGYKYNHNPMKTKTGIAGYDLKCRDTTAMFSFSLKQGADSLYPFNEVVVYHKNKELKIVRGADVRTEFQILNSDLYATRLLLGATTWGNSLCFRNDPPGFQLYGLELRNNKPGIRYHAIGINGLNYDAYLNTIEYLPMLKALHPEAIIISLGTNDAYVKQLDEARFKTKVEAVVLAIRKELPGCCIILTTPGDHLFNKRYINPNLLKVQSAIIAVATGLHCVYWDFFSVMGGLGASKKWAHYGGMYKDIVHLSKPGYKWQGEMLFEAFDKAIEASQVP